MTLNEKLLGLKAASRGKLSAETQKIMADALSAIEATDQKGRALAPGDAAPAFTLADHAGRLWTSTELLKEGPLVVNFFRGSW
ncbi:hypothetical protein DSOUD_1731 [Desulfuromonas soudanensis]|uniref:Alkyl hydroperoxide reductase subunit C/ Thiol specific antioxidant domain-containing protein n=1 Tax=Desulfuromonas soudanensis TaxID=1603606 RepID=A0A0M3QFM9_9BACT|nr:hypothetical protein [Desulfuromonas soudanensis]ALC16509.1 hypothetical protein DSOUD_1731 [Desulfuromonas soudanensis]